MTPQILQWFGTVREAFPFAPGRVLEVGSRNINGSPRPFFKDATEYVGIDMEDGEGVDRVVNASDILRAFGIGSFETVICCEMLEHDIDFRRTIALLYYALRQGGYLIITTPTFGFPLHRYPKDYWRFGEDAFREVFFAGFELLHLMHLDDAVGPNLTLAGIGRKK